MGILGGYTPPMVYAIPPNFPPRPQGDPSVLWAAAAQLNNEANHLTAQSAVTVPATWIGDGEQGFQVAWANTKGATTKLMYQMQAVAQAMQEYASAISMAQQDYDWKLQSYQQLSAQSPNAHVLIRGVFDTSNTSIGDTQAAQLLNILANLQDDITKLDAARRRFVAALAQSQNANQTLGVPYAGGAVQNNPHIYTVFLGNDWFTKAGKAQQQTDNKFFQSLPGSWFQYNLQQYGKVGKPTLVASVNDTLDQSPKLMDVPHLGAIAAAIAQRSGWKVNSNSQIVVLPSSQTQFAADQNGFHTFTTIGSNMVPISTIAYTPTIYATNGSRVPVPQTMFVSHEYAETVTDPNQTTGWGGTAANSASQSGQHEVGDLCNGLPAIMGNGIAVQQIWNQAGDKCVGRTTP